MADVLAAEQIFNMTTLNDELIGSLDWVSEDAWTRRPSDGEWSVAEIVGHVIELEPHWARQAAEIVARPGTEVARELDDPGRLAGPNSGPGVNPKEARTRLAHAGEEAAQILRRIPDSAWTTTGKSGGKDVTVGDLVHAHIVEHVRQHLEQVTSVLALV
ncbi:MAG TPA: DinB family protein [Dehalococcoidia bacterium]|nr:DinB family protein [Dehalococcoidia bacterium]